MSEVRKRYQVIKHMIIAASHQLKLPYESKCNNMHGHNYSVSVHIEGDYLNEHGILYDFKRIKDVVHKPLDHTNLNDIFGYKSTAEHIAKWIFDQVEFAIAADWDDVMVDTDGSPRVFLVEVAESDGNKVCYRK
jgi:6-pyruvoyltetrahydropterin/6-carboxytetrahydropterin synthase